MHGAARLRHERGPAPGGGGHLPGVARGVQHRPAGVAEFYSSIALNEALWKQIKAFADTDEAKALTGTRRRFLEKTMADFRRHGADLDAEGKKRLQEIDVELTQLTTKFAENVSTRPTPTSCDHRRSRASPGCRRAPSRRHGRAPQAKNRKAGDSHCRRRATSPL